MRYRLSTLLIWLTIGPLGLAGIWQTNTDDWVRVVYLGLAGYTGFVLLFCYIMGIGDDLNSEPPPHV